MKIYLTITLLKKIAPQQPPVATQVTQGYFFYLPKLFF